LAMGRNFLRRFLKAVLRVYLVGWDGKEKW
jgi:hypothetical protein